MSTILSSTATDIIRDSLLLCGVIDSNQSVKPQENADALRILNLMVKGWQSNEYLWKYSDVQVTLTPGTTSYVVGPAGLDTLNRIRPLRLLYATRKTTNVDIPLEIISRQEYLDLPNKDQEGPPVVAYYDPQLTNGEVFVWFTGDSGNLSLTMTFTDPIDLFDSSSDTPDFPDEWIEPITYNLAVRLAPMFGATVPQEVVAVANESLDRMKNFDAEVASIRFMPRRR